jgi:galactokinase/mevalonate kinase-like predicted kinase
MGLTVKFSAPGRCGIIGNPSDIYGGKVLSCSLPLRNSVTIQTGETAEPNLPDDLRLWNAALAELPLNVPVKSVEYHSEVPKSSGLAGSTALLSALVAAIRCLRSESFHPSPELAEQVRYIERHHAEVMCGYQDAYMTVHGGLQLMNFAGKHPVQPGPAASLQPIKAELPFLIITTGVERLSGSVHGPMSERWLEGENAVVEGITAISALAEAGLPGLLAENWTELAKVMTENQRIIRDLGGSGDQIDQLIARCLEHGALSAKLAGAGMGGTVIALTENAAELEERLRQDGYSRFTRPVISEGVRQETSG